MMNEDEYVELSLTPFFEAIREVYAPMLDHGRSEDAAKFQFGPTEVWAEDVTDDDDEGACGPECAGCNEDVPEFVALHLDDSERFEPGSHEVLGDGEHNEIERLYNVVVGPHGPIKVAIEMDKAAEVVTELLSANGWSDWDQAFFGNVSADDFNVEDAQDLIAIGYLLATLNRGDES